MRVQAAFIERAPACGDAGLSSMRKAEAVSTTAVANAGENSNLDADAMHATLPLKKASSPGRGRSETTPCGRVEGEGAAVASAAADAADWARDWCALSTTRDVPRAAVFACSISSSNRRRFASRWRIVWLASSRARWARAAPYAKSKEPAWAPRSPQLCQSTKNPGDGAPPGLARAGVDPPPSPVEVGPPPSLREPVSRPSWLVGPDGGMVVRLLSRHRNPPPEAPPVSSRGISDELSVSRGYPNWGAWKTSACPE